MLRRSPLLVVLAACGMPACTAVDIDELPELRPPTFTLTARVNGAPVTFEGFGFVRDTPAGPRAEVVAQECGLAEPFTYRGLVKILYIDFDGPAAGRAYGLSRRALGTALPDDSAHALIMDAAGDAVSESYSPAADAHLTVVTYDEVNGFVSGSLEGSLASTIHPGSSYRIEGGRFTGRFERLAAGQSPQRTATRCYQPGG